MISRTLRIALTVAGVTAFIACILIPLVAIIIRAVADWHAPPGGYFSSSRQWLLLAKTLALATTATVTTLLLSLPGGYLVGHPPTSHLLLESSSPRPLVPSFPFFFLFPFLLPPMITTFGWQRLLGPHTPGFESLSPMIRCVLIWSTWAWPIPAFIIGAGWSRAGRDAYEAALLETNVSNAFRRAVLPILSRHIIVSAIILLVIFLGEYTVPHANGLTVVATELLVTARSAQLGDCLRQSIPLVASIFVFLFVARRLFPVADPALTDPRARSAPPTSGFNRVSLLVLAIVIVTLAVPITTLAWRPSLIQDITAAYRTYTPELAATFAVALGSAVSVTLLGIASVPFLFPSPPCSLAPSFSRSLVSSFPRFLVPSIPLFFALLPGPLIGEAVIAAYQSIPAIYDHWPILVIALTARYAWVGLLAAWLAARSVPPQLIALATIDGTDERTARFSFLCRHHWPILIAGVFVAASMSLSDITVIAMVQVPAPRMLSTILMEKFHRFETGMLVAISLTMLASILPGAILITCALRRRAT